MVGRLDPVAHEDMPSPQTHQRASLTRLSERLKGSVLEDREVTTTARSPARQGFLSICAKAVRLVDWPVDWDAISVSDDPLL